MHPVTPPPTGMSHDVLLSLVISVASFLLLLVGWFLVRTLKQVEDAIQASKAETTALRAELGTVKSDLKEYAGHVQRQNEELTTLKRAYASLLEAFRVLDRWIYGQHAAGKLPEPPTLHPFQPD